MSDRDRPRYVAAGGGQVGVPVLLTRAGEHRLQAALRFWGC